MIVEHAKVTWILSVMTFLEMAVGQGICGMCADLWQALGASLLR